MKLNETIKLMIIIGKDGLQMHACSNVPKSASSPLIRDSYYESRSSIKLSLSSTAVGLLTGHQSKQIAT